MGQKIVSWEGITVPVEDDDQVIGHVVNEKQKVIVIQRSNGEITTHQKSEVNISPAQKIKPATTINGKGNGKGKEDGNTGGQA